MTATRRMTLAQVRRHALSLEGANEEPHFDRTSFRVNGKIFATARQGEPYLHVFVDETVREPALALHPGAVEKLPWGAKIVGLRVRLADAPAPLVRDLLRAAWAARARKTRPPAGRHRP